MSELVFGLDLGLNNVGWAAVSKADDNVQILAMGTYVFPSPLEQDQDATSGLKSRDRGIKKRARRNLRRRRARRQVLYSFLADAGYLPTSFEERDRLLSNFKIEGQDVHPYALRAKALDQPLTPFELGRVLCHLNQRRGFLSPRDLMLLGVAKVEEAIPAEQEGKKKADEDTGLILGEIKQTKLEMQTGGFRTLGEYLNSRLQSKLPIRKKTSEAAVKAGRLTKVEHRELMRQRFVRADRHMITDEFDAIVKAQAPHHPLLQNQADRLRHLIFFQRPMEADSGLRGTCTLFPSELRIPRASLLAQKFDIAQRVANLRVLDSSEGDFEYRPLGRDEREALVNELMTGRSLSWGELKDVAGIPQQARFYDEPLSKGGKVTTKKGARITAKDGLVGSQTITRLRAALGAKWDQLDEESIQNIVDIIVSVRDWIDKKKDAAGRVSDYASPQFKVPQPAAKRRFDLFLTKEFGPQGVRFSQAEAADLATLDLPEGYLNLSRKAIRKILPLMISGPKAPKDGFPQGPMTYDAACRFIGVDHSRPVEVVHGLERLPYPTDKDIQHPLVRCSVRNAVRVLNALRKEFGKPDRINIELPRDLALSAEQREEVQKKIDENTRNRAKIRERLSEARLPLTKDNIRRVQLFYECGGRLPYDPDHVLADITEACSPDIEVDHIVPRAHSFDDSLGNLVLATSATNREKGDRTPFEAFGGDPDRWAKIVTFAKGSHGYSKNKRARLIAKERPEDFTGRHLAAVGYISSQVKRLAEQMVDQPANAVVAPGRATSTLRSLWQLDGLIPLHPEEEAERDRFRAALVEAEQDGIWPRFYKDEKGKEKEIKEPNGKSRSNYLHHAVDALVVALTDRSTLQKVAKFYQDLEKGLPTDARKEKHREVLPIRDFRAIAQKALETAVVVHKPDRKATGQLNKETAYAPPNGTPTGQPNSSQIVSGKLIRYDHKGKPAQMYELGNNHHVAIFESTVPDKNGEFLRFAEVVSNLEVARRRGAGEPIVKRYRDEPNWRFVMSLCKGDMVEMADGRRGVVSKFNQKSAGTALLYVWWPYVATQVGALNRLNPYLVTSISSASGLHEIRGKVDLDIFGRVTFREP